MANYDHPIQELQRGFAGLNDRLTALTTENTNLKTKVATLEGQAQEPKTTVVNNPAPVNNTTVVPQPEPQPAPVVAQPAAGSGMKQMLLMLLMSMMQPQAAPTAPVNPYTTPLFGSPLMPSNSLLGANPLGYGNNGSAFGGLNWNTFTPTFGGQQPQAVSPFATANSTYGSLSPIRL